MAHAAYKFRLYPNTTQAKAMASQLETLRRVYNDALQLSKDVYATTGKSPKSGYLNRVLTLSRNAQLDDQKEGCGGPKWLTQVSAVSLRDVCARVEAAFDNFFRRLKQKTAKAGFPRFKSYGKLTSIPFENTYPSGCVLRTADGELAGTVVKTVHQVKKSKSKDGKGTWVSRDITDIPESRKGYRLDVFGVGKIKVIAHRAMVGTVKTACVERDVDGKWYVVLVCQHDAPKAEPNTNPPVGIDVGLERFLTKSDGDYEPNPRILKGNLKTLRRVQKASSRKMEAAKKRKAKFRECKNLQKSFRKTAKLHVRVRNLRKEHHCHTANCLVNEYGAICVENLNIRGMVKNGKLSRAIQDAGWGSFLNVLKRKAENAGVQFVEVNPSGTSQTCPQCGAVVKKKLSQREHNCPCGCKLHRDHASALVILARGLPSPAG